MPSPTREADLPGPAPPERAARILGVVDNAGADTLYGWAWNAAQQGERLLVELRLAGSVVAEAVADRARADLPKAGIGDGSHAFALKLTPACKVRLGEVSVIARSADGSSAPLPFRLSAGQRSVAAIAAGQHHLREEVRRLAARLPADDEAGLERRRTVQERLEGRVSALDARMAQLADRLAGGQPMAAAQAPGRAGAAWLALLAGLILAVGSAAVSAALLLAG